MGSRHLLSKSTYLRGLQCAKSLYLNKYKPHLKDPLDDKTKKLFNGGHEVGALARLMFPGGVDCGMEVTSDAQKSVRMTEYSIAEGKSVIYEAAFQYDDVLTIADIIIKDSNGWVIYEVKSSTDVKDYHIFDAGIQYYTAINSGIEINNFYIVHINTDYIRRDAIDVEQLFKMHSVKDMVIDQQKDIPSRINRMKKILTTGKEPEIDIGTHCYEPFNCDYHGHCWEKIPEYSVFNISKIGSKAFELYNKGITDIKDIRDDISLTDTQKKEVDAYKSGEPHILKARIKEFTDSIIYPLYFLDFETIMPAVPKYDNSRPYQQIPFQYSMHKKEYLSDNLIHKEYLADGKSDPREEFINRLIEDLETEGTILVYNMSFERTRLEETARDFPEYRIEIDKIIYRMTDLMQPFASRAYYTPEMKGSHSLKSVLPALVPGEGYEKLRIQDGQNASMEFERLMSMLSVLSGSSSKEISRIRKNLLEYCRMDTYAMVLIFNKLLKTADECNPEK